MVYIIKAKYRSGGDAEGQYNILKEWGDFRSTIDFTVHLEGNDAVKPTGIIVQKIEKSTWVDIYNNNGGGFEQKLQTTQEIYEYTGGNVPFMNDDYLEIFNVENGEVVDENGNPYGDQFQNGGICEYDEQGNMCDDELDMSIGEIQQIGKCVFILNNNPNYHAILNLNWIIDNNSPANGLRYMPLPQANAVWENILHHKDSNIYIHRVQLNWRYLNIIQQDRSKSYTDSFFQVMNVPGGGARKYTKRKKLKKRKKRKKHTKKK